MRFILAIIIIFSGNVYAEEDEFGFVYTWGFVNAYNSFNQLYTKHLCTEKEFYSKKIELEEDFLNRVHSKLDEANFWLLTSDYLVTYSLEERVLIISPCSDREFFAQNGTGSNYIWAACGDLPKAAAEEGKKLMEIFEEIEDAVSSSRKYKSAPDDKCSFY